MFLFIAKVPTSETLYEVVAYHDSIIPVGGLLFVFLLAFMFIVFKWYPNRHSSPSVGRSCYRLCSTCLTMYGKFHLFLPSSNIFYHIRNCNESCKNYALILHSQYRLEQLNEITHDSIIPVGWDVVFILIGFYFHCFKWYVNRHSSQSIGRSCYRL
jgi:hypothetical protein